LWLPSLRTACGDGATTRVAPTAGNAGGRRLWATLRRYDFDRRFNLFRLAEANDQTDFDWDVDGAGSVGVKEVPSMVEVVVDFSVPIALLERMANWLERMAN
jgi:hypothetical protein